MRLFLVAMLVGGLWGRRRGGTLRSLSALAFRASFVVRTALAMQLGLGFWPLRELSTEARFGVVLFSYALVAAWLALNALAHAPAMRSAIALIAVGWLLNLLAIVPNGGMPVSRSAAAQIGVSPSVRIENGFMWKHVSVSDSTALVVFGDIIPVPPLRSVLSIGDLVMAAGLALSVSTGMKPDRRRSSRTRVCRATAGSIPRR